MAKKNCYANKKTIVYKLDYLKNDLVRNTKGQWINILS